MGLKCWEFKAFCNKYQRILLLILLPLFLAILPIVVRTKAAYCAYVVILMCFFWLFTILPIGITALLPVVFFPLFGIMSSKDATIGYFQDIVMLFFGTLVVSNAIEQTRLHERIALRLLTLFGTEPKWLLLGFMCITAFLSLWISNAASTSIMLPIVLSVVQQLIKCDPKYSEIDGFTTTSYDIVQVPESTTTLDTIENQSKVNETAPRLEVVQINDEPGVYKTEAARKLATAFLISCAYAAIIGGVGSLVGTAPNLLFKGYMNNHYPKIPVTFLTFTMYGLPVSLIMIILTWIWLVIRWLPKSFCKCGKKVSSEGEVGKSVNFKDVLVKNYNELGPITWGQSWVAVIFLFLIVSWITREFGTIPGWSYIFPDPEFITDTTPAIIAVVLIFVCPRENIFKGHAYRHLIDFKDLQRSFPWSIILLCGGALVMADGFEESGLSLWVGEQLKHLTSVNKETTLAVIIFIGIITSEFASNTADAAILLPIIDSLAKQHGVNPVYFLLPLTLSVSLAFMMPVGTPNMTIVYTIGNLRMKDMVLTGVVVNILAFLTIFLASNTWFYLVFDPKTGFDGFKNATFITNLTKI